MSSTAQEHSLFDIDRELDTLLDEIEEEIENRGDGSLELVERFHQFCEAHGEKADPICAKTNSRMVISQSIVDAGEGYHLDMRALNSDSGAILAQVQGTSVAGTKSFTSWESQQYTFARSRENSQLRWRVFNQPLERALSPSLEALQAGTEGTAPPRRRCCRSGKTLSASRRTGS